MRTPSYWRPALHICAAGLLASCTSALTPPAFAPSTQPGRAFVAAKTQSLLYISDLGANAVDYYSYPKGQLQGKLTGFGSVAGLCADKGGNVFVVDEAGPVQMFAHGGTTPIRKLPTSGAPYGCAVDPTSGNLALTQLSSYQHGAIAIYPKAKGSPKVYKDKNVDATWFCGYDDRGNLFTDAWDSFGTNILLELAKGGKSFKKFYLPKNFQNPGGVQWDGRYVAVSNRGAGVIYRITETGHVAATVKVKDGASVEQFWIAGTTLIGPNAQSPGTVPFWRYPAGGAPSKTLRGFYYPFGAAVSVAQ